MLLFFYLLTIYCSSSYSFRLILSTINYLANIGTRQDANRNYMFISLTKAQSLFQQPLHTFCCPLVK